MCAHMGTVVCALWRSAWHCSGVVHLTWRRHWTGPKLTNTSKSSGRDSAVTTSPPLGSQLGTATSVFLHGFWGSDSGPQFTSSSLCTKNLIFWISYRFCCMKCHHKGRKYLFKKHINHEWPHRITGIHTLPYLYQDCPHFQKHAWHSRTLFIGYSDPETQVEMRKWKNKSRPDWFTPWRRADLEPPCLKLDNEK